MLRELHHMCMEAAPPSDVCSEESPSRTPTPSARPRLCQRSGPVRAITTQNILDLGVSTLIGETERDGGVRSHRSTAQALHPQSGPLPPRLRKFKAASSQCGRPHRPREGKRGPWDPSH